jgi:hypothetical protein
VTLQTHVLENFRSCRWGDEQTVKRAQTVSEDPRRKRNISNMFISLLVLGGLSNTRRFAFVRVGEVFNVNWWDYSQSCHCSRGDAQWS